MNTMNFIVWMLPILIMLHDFEEIVMAEGWAKKYGKTVEKVFQKWRPFGLKYIHGCYTPAFAVGVEVVFVLSVLTCLLSVAFQNYYFWFAFLMGWAMHLVFIHLPMCFRFRHYVPGAVTSVLLLAPNIWFLYQAEKILRYSPVAVLQAFVMIAVLTVVYIPAMHKLLGPVSKMIGRYSEKPPK